MPEYLNFLIFFLNKHKGILEILIGFNGKFLRRVEIENKIKLEDGYLKLTLFKVWIPFCKSDERSKIINEVFPNFFVVYFYTLFSCTKLVKT
jgi:hypothetical protein